MFTRLRVILVVVLLIFSMTGCATMHSSSMELSQLENDEGIVIGSFEAAAEKDGQDKKFLGITIGGLKSAESEYRVQFSKKTLNPFPVLYDLDLKADMAQTFIKKLPVGTYVLHRIYVKSIYWDFNLQFSVKPKQTTYIGRATVNFPYRLMSGPADLTISDSMEADLRKVKDEYGLDLSNITKELMVKY